MNPTLPEEAVKAAQNAIRTTNWEYGITDADMAKALTAALPHLLGVGVKKLEWEYVERAVMTYVTSDDRGMLYYINQSFGSDSYYFATARYSDGTVLYDGDDLPSAKAAAQADYEARILSALEPSVGRAAVLEEGDLQELLERLDAGLDYEGELETENDHIELFNVEAAQDLFADAAAAIRALSSPAHNADAGKVEGDGIERAKFYHHQWPMERLLAARRDGLVDHSGGEAWRYEYSHKDEHGKYDILYRPVKNSTIPARLPSAPSEGAE